MFKALLAVIGVAVVVLPILFILGAAVGGSGRTSGQQQSPSGEGSYMAAVGFLAVVAAVILGATVGAAWAVLPVGVWALFFIAARYVDQPTLAEERQPTQQTAPPRDKRSFGKDGAALLERADQAVEQVMASDAVKAGWLGPLDGLNLQADVAVIEDRLRRVTGIRQVITEFSLLADPSDTDRTNQGEAKHAEAKLYEDAQDRVKRLEKLAREVQATDREIRLRSLTEVDDVGTASPPEVADSARAMLYAYRDVKGLSELESTPDQTGRRAIEGKKTPASSSQGFFDTLKQWWDS